MSTVTSYVGLTVHAPRDAYLLLLQILEYRPTIAETHWVLCHPTTAVEVKLSLKRSQLDVSETVDNVDSSNSQITDVNEQQYHSQQLDLMRWVDCCCCCCQSGV